MFLFNPKLNDCAEWSKTDNRTVSYKHCNGGFKYKLQGGLKYKLNNGACTIIQYQNEPKQSNANRNAQAARKANIWLHAHYYR